MRALLFLAQEGRDTNATTDFRQRVEQNAADTEEEEEDEEEKNAAAGEKHAKAESEVASKEATQEDEAADPEYDDQD